MFSGAAVVDKGYFDVPIYDKYSNKEIPRSINYADEFDVNKKINLKINSNKDEYIVKQYPTRPSASLYYETDNASSNYYNPNYQYRYYDSIEQFDNINNNDNKNKIFFFILLILILCFFIFCCK
jgi:hypothetical protein